MLQRQRAGFRSPVWRLQGVLERAYGPLLPSKKRRAQSQAAAVQMLRQELAQVIRQSLLYTHYGRMLEVRSCTAQRGPGVKSLSVGRNHHGKDRQHHILLAKLPISTPAPCRFFSAPTRSALNLGWAITACLISQDSSMTLKLRAALACLAGS